MNKNQKIKESVKQHYAEIAKGGATCCSTGETSCCGPECSDVTNLSHGYTIADLANLPEGADLGLGCGNPLTLIEIKPGWKVLDLGSGAGIDVFLTARQVGDKGKAVGLDMTDEMLEKARENARKGGFENVEFVKGEIESMPFANDTFDLVISNCVINLVPDKALAYKEIRRVLKPGGHFAIADMATRGQMPESIRKSAEAWAGCIAGALDLDGYLKTIREVGFTDVEAKFVNEYDYAKSEDYALLSVGLVGTKK